MARNRRTSTCMSVWTGLSRLGCMLAGLLLLRLTDCVVSQSLGDTLEVLEDLSHECVRACVPGQSKVCRYTFKVEWYTTLGKACYACPFNVTDCARPHCAPADGFERAIVTVNRRLPGPSIHVCQWDEVVVDVVNELGSDSTTIHWHGIHQRGTPFMDGVPFLTQCPIPAGTTFRYHFLADQPGTQYWHSHSGFQRADGMFGALVVHEPKENDPQRHLYDEDDPRHTLVLTDWLEGLGIAKFVNHHHTEHDNKPYTLLVNGRGRYVKHEQEGVAAAYTPVYEVTVAHGRRYRFRAVSNSIQNCPIVVSLDQHILTPITTDGYPIEPVEVESLTIYGGERWDFVVFANQTPAAYWFRFQGMLDCDERFKSAHQVAVLRYEGTEGLPGSLDDVNYQSTVRKGLVLNKLNAAPGDGTFITAAEIRGTKPLRDLSRTPDYKFWLEFDFYGKDNPTFHHPDLYPFDTVREGHRLFSPQINEISLKLPNAPPLSQPEDIDVSAFCNATAKKNCIGNFCHCPHVLSVEKDSLVELMLVDEGVVYWANHPFHLHGHAFYVLAMGRLGENTTKDEVQALDEAGLIERNFDHPPTKDTVTVPDGGYTVVRFFASNPGYWLFHCHISFHVEVGMGLVFHVGTHEMLPSPPPSFPKCGHWTPPLDPYFKTKLDHYFKGQNIQVDIDLDLLPGTPGVTGGDWGTGKGTMQQGPSYSTPTRPEKIGHDGGGGGGGTVIAQCLHVVFGVFVSVCVVGVYI